MQIYHLVPPPDRHRRTHVPNIKLFAFPDAYMHLKKNFQDNFKFS